MTSEEAKEILNQDPLTFNIEDSMYGDGSVSVSYGLIFDTKLEAEQWVEAIKTLAK